LQLISAERAIDAEAQKNPISQTPLHPIENSPIAQV
jgi:hypothetical protein